MTSIERIAYPFWLAKPTQVLRCGNARYDYTEFYGGGYLLLKHKKQAKESTSKKEFEKQKWLRSCYFEEDDRTK